MHTSGDNSSPGCPASVLELVTRFELHSETYKQQTYNETQVRREFIDPLFEALGWDVDNKGGNAEAYKDVIHEDANKIGATDKQIDKLVYELYDLTNDEIAIVEDAIQR